MSTANTPGVPTGTNLSVSPYASSKSLGQPEPLVPVGTPPLTRHDATTDGRPESLDALAKVLGFTRPEWMLDAACVEHTELNFIPDRGDDVRPLLAVCARCLVCAECLDYALADPSIVGVWGGTTGQARRRLRSQGFGEDRGHRHPGIPLAVSVNLGVPEFLGDPPTSGDPGCRESLSREEPGVAVRPATPRSVHTAQVQHLRPLPAPQRW